MISTLSGIVIVLIEVHHANAFALMLITSLGIIKSTNFSLFK